jgi:radical SAM protein with 4Fe4S-binding SPASM domain
MQMDFLTEKVRKKMLRKRNEVPQKTKCTNGADMGMFQWDGQLRSCYMDYNGENTYGNIIENNAIDLFLNKNRRLFIDNIVNGNHKLNYVCKDCLSPYNIRTNELLLERPDGKQISLQGNNWDSVKCSPEWDKVK